MDLFGIVSYRLEDATSLGGSTSPARLWSLLTEPRRTASLYCNYPYERLAIFVKSFSDDFAQMLTANTNVPAIDNADTGSGCNGWSSPRARNDRIRVSTNRGANGIEGVN